MLRRKNNIMKKYFLVLLLCMAFLHSIYAQEETFSALIGKSKAFIQSQNKQHTEYTFDDSITEVFVYGSDTFLTVFIFHDTIIKVSVVNDGTLFDEISTVDTSYEDNTLIQKFENYFLSAYHRKPEFNSIPMGLREIKNKFGLACGSAGSPTEFGKRYLMLADKTTTQEGVKQLLLSFNPYERLYGLLIYDQHPYNELAEIADLIRANSYTYNFCSGCMPEPNKTAKQISEPKRTEK